MGCKSMKSMFGPKSKNIIKRPIEWAMWANVLAVYAGEFLFVGGILSQFGFSAPGVGIFSIAWGVLLIIFEWPRSKRLKGTTTLERRGQQYLTPIIAKLGFISQIYLVRGILYILTAVPGFFSLPCTLGGAVLAVSGIVYVFAGYLGEQWTPIEPRKPETFGLKTISEAPTKPPPRLIHHSTSKVDVAPTRAPPRAPPADIIAQEASKPAVTSKPKVQVRAASVAMEKSQPPSRAPPALRPEDISEPPSRAPPVLPSMAQQPQGPVEPSNVAATIKSLNAESSVTVKPKPRPKPATLKPVEFHWESFKDATSGDVYYHNSQTNETTWTKPAGWDEHQAAHSEA